MTPEKLYKYKNFKLKSKHIYAKKKLENIMNNILLNKLYGGAVPDEIIDKIDTFFTEEMNEMKGHNGTSFDPNINTVTIAFTEQLKDFVSILPSDNEETKKLLKSLIDADSTLNDEFKNIMKNNQIVDGNTEILLKIQKSLFNLQAKIIFSSLTKIDKVDISPLLKAFHTKFEAMNDYIQAQEDEFKKNNFKPKISESYNQRPDEKKSKTASMRIFNMFKNSESVPDAKSGPKSVPVPDAKSGPKSVPDAKSGPDSGAKSEAKSGAKSEAKSGAKSEAKSGAKSGAKSDPVPVSVTDAKSKIITSTDLYKYFKDVTILGSLFYIAVENKIGNFKKITADEYTNNDYKINNQIFSNIFDIIVNKYKSESSIKEYLNTDEKIDIIKYYLNNTTDNIGELINKEDDDDE
jgi:hypothetical protein